MKLSLTWLLVLGVFPISCELTPYYREDVNMTISGIPCQRWGSTAVHLPSPKYRSLGGNFCSKLDSPCPWCYTMDPDLRYDYCFDCYATSVEPASTNSTVPPRQTPHPRNPKVHPGGNAAVNAERIYAGGISRHAASLDRTEPPAAVQDVEGRGTGEPR
ncbi:PLG [Branchiostoma lanceolatum]|uniref:PLG protein n=1 Tax=Branchiostoma lanceolatum TaxID=7740 RepID=A0A8K0E991_BRALA|nr:PLG [Branchiostoma lanceolatum]